VITGDVPTVCPAQECRQETTWTTSKPYQTNANDRKFLHSIHVSGADREK
jgi:hypothetical protein